WLLCHQVKLVEAEALLRACAEGFEAEGWHASAARALAMHARALNELNRLEEGEQALARAVTLSERFPAVHAMTLRTRAAGLARRRDNVGAERVLRRALACLETEEAHERVGLLVDLSSVVRRLGREGESHAILMEARRRAGSR